MEVRCQFVKVCSRLHIILGGLAEVRFYSRQQTEPLPIDSPDSLFFWDSVSHAILVSNLLVAKPDFLHTYLYLSSARIIYRGHHSGFM